MELVPAPAFVKVLAELAGLPDDSGYEPAGAPALLLGQYLSALELMTPAEEEELHVAMVRGAVERGHRELVFKPHPPPRRRTRAAPRRRPPGSGRG